MKLWDFVHQTTPFHVYEFLALILLAVLAAVAIIHTVKTRKATGESDSEQKKGGR